MGYVYLALKITIFRTAKLSQLHRTSQQSMMILNFVMIYNENMIESKGAYREIIKCKSIWRWPAYSETRECDLCFVNIFNITIWYLQCACVVLSCYHGGCLLLIVCDLYFLNNSSPVVIVGRYIWLLHQQHAPLWFLYIYNILLR